MFHSKLRVFLNEELKYWREKEEADKENIVATNGGTCEVLYLLDNVSSITREMLLERHKIIKDRKSGSKMYQLASLSMERDEIRLEAIKRVGKKVNEMQKEMSRLGFGMYDIYKRNKNDTLDLLIRQELSKDGSHINLEQGMSKFINSKEAISL